MWTFLWLSSIHACAYVIFFINIVEYVQTISKSCYLLRSNRIYPSRFLDWKKELELRRKLFFRIQTIREIYAANTAVCMDLNSECFYIISTISTSGEVREIELDLIPSFIEPHGHCTNERFDTRRWLVVWRAKTASHALIIQHLNFKREILFQVLDNHYEEW